MKRGIGWAGATWLVLAVVLVGGCALGVDDSAEPPDEVGAEPDVVEKSISITNGLRAINGLTAKNGLMSFNGLTLRNGLRLRNGLISINGLATKNGLSTINGRSVNCAGMSDCTGAPDGLLSARRGLLKDKEGINLASYMIRCALPADRTITAQRWDGKHVSFTGELGLTPEWEAGECTTQCQEKVTACLLSLVNGSGEHIPITISAEWAKGALREIPDPRLLQEAVFFGNVFTDPPHAYVAIHRDWARALEGVTRNDVISVPRMCSGVEGITAANYAAQHERCPIRIVGEAGQFLWERDFPGIGEDYNVCFMAKDGAHAYLCRLNGDDYKWTFPLTTFVSKRVW